jgi:hypothetical protein
MYVSVCLSRISKDVDNLHGRDSLLRNNGNLNLLSILLFLLLFLLLLLFLSNCHSVTRPRRVGHPFASTISGYIIQSSGGSGLPRVVMQPTWLYQLRGLIPVRNTPGNTPTATPNQVYLTSGFFSPRPFPKILTSLGPGQMRLLLHCFAHGPLLHCLAH